MCRGSPPVVTRDTVGTDQPDCFANHGGAVASLADQAEYFVGELGPGQGDAYLASFRFGPRELSRRLRPPGGLKGLELRSETVAGRRIFYQMRSRRLRGRTKPRWRNSGEVQAELGVANPQARDLRLHAGAVAVVSLLLSAGVLLLARDSSREARIDDLRTALVNGACRVGSRAPIALVHFVRRNAWSVMRSPSPEERRDFYRIVTRESTRLGRLVDQILSVLPDGAGGT